MATTAIVAQPGKRVRPRLGRVLGILAVVVAAVLVLGYFGISAYVGDRLSRPDRKALVGETPAQYGLTYEDVTFNSAVDNIPLSGWLVDSPGDKAIIMLHGRDQNRNRDEAFVEKAALLSRNNYDVLMFDFRAHGLSGGERYGLGVWETRDVAGALDYLKSRGYTEFGTYGVSMGAAISLLAAPDHPEIKALMVDSPYADLPALINAKLPAESGLPAFFNPGIFLMGKVLYGLDFSNVKPGESVAALGDRPIFHVQSRDGDDSVPLTEGYAIQQAGASNPNFTSWLAPGKGHVHSYTNNKDEYTKRMLQFYGTYLK